MLRSFRHQVLGAALAVAALFAAGQAFATGTVRLEFVKAGVVLTAQSVSSSGASVQSAAAPDFGNVTGQVRIYGLSGAVIVTPAAGNPTATQTNGYRLQSCSDPITLTIGTGQKVAIIEASDASACPAGGGAGGGTAAGIFFLGTTTPLTGSATYTGATRDVGVAASTAHPYAYFNGFFFADQAGTATLECSNDNSAWTTCAASALVAATPLTLSVPVMFRYHRTKLVNGAAAQTALVVNSSFTGG